MCVERMDMSDLLLIIVCNLIGLIYYSLLDITMYGLQIFHSFTSSSLVQSSLASSLHLHDIRHLVIEDLMMRQKRGKTFIPNSIDMACTPLPESTRTCILTGPNMGGKTTFLRSVALCVILAQMGCFIPAKEGCIGVVDKIFSRVGSADDIVNDRSTFYSEISETATILKNGRFH